MDLSQADKQRLAARACLMLHVPAVECIGTAKIFHGLWCWTARRLYRETGNAKGRRIGICPKCGKADIVDPKVKTTPFPEPKGKK